MGDPVNMKNIHENILEKAFSHSVRIIPDRRQVIDEITSLAFGYVEFHELVCECLQMTDEQNYRKIRRCVIALSRMIKTLKKIDLCKRDHLERLIPQMVFMYFYEQEVGEVVNFHLAPNTIKFDNDVPTEQHREAVESDILHQQMLVKRKNEDRFFKKKGQILSNF